MPKIKTLRAHPLFADLSDHDLALFSRIVLEADYPSGKLLFTEGKTSLTFYLVQRGRVGVVSTSAVGQGVVMGEGDFFGQWALLAPEHPAAVSAKVLEGASLLSVNREDFARFSEEEPATAFKVLRALLAGAWPDLAWAKEKVKG